MNFKFILSSILALISSLSWGQGTLSSYVKAYNLPALSVGIIQNNKFQIVSVGVKNSQTREPITARDTFHLGSEAKAMTAYLINKEVKAGRLSYETLVQQLYSFAFHPDFKNLKIKDLLLHEAGLPRGIVNARTIVTQNPNNITLQRFKVAEELLTQAPVYPLGTSSGYSNAGYVILGNILERIHKKTVEEIFVQNLFRPFQMSSCGFGINHTATGHYIDTKTSNLVPVKDDNFQLFASAGTVYCNLEDWGKFLSFQMKAIQKKESYLWQVSKKSYTLGAMFLYRDKQGQPYFWHNGTNCINYADQAILPAQNKILMFATNRGGDEKMSCDDKYMDELRELFNKLLIEYK